MTQCAAYEEKYRGRAVKTVSLALLGVLLAFTGSAATLMEGFTPGVDQEILQVFSTPAGGTALLVKKFLDPRKVKSDPERAKKLTVEIHELAGASPLLVLELGAKQQITVGRPLAAGDGFVFALSYGSGGFDLFRYGVKAGDVQRMDIAALKSRIDADGPSEKVFLVSGGLVVIRTDLGAQWAGFYANEGGKMVRLNLPPGPIGAQLLSVDDAVQTGQTLRLLASAAVDLKDNRSEAWLLSFDKGLLQVGAQIDKLDVGVITASQSRFLATDHEFLSVEVSSRSGVISAPTISLFAVMARPVEIWSHRLPSPEAVRDLALAGVCGNSYVVARRVRGNKPGYPDVEWAWIEANGAESTLTRKVDIDGSVISLQLLPRKGELLSLINYSKTEEVRRSDGWYSWAGYRLDSLNTQSRCNAPRRQ